MQLQNELSLSYLFTAYDLLVVRHTSGRAAVMYRGVVAEEGIAEEIFSYPVHPYIHIEVICSAILVPDRTLRVKRYRIIPDADIPSLLHPVRGCLFATPCPLGEESFKMKAAIDINLAGASDFVSGPSVSMSSTNCVMRFRATLAQSEMLLKYSGRVSTNLIYYK